ncbi:MAG: alpha/beta fold hydrolase [Clostridia bacterium]|nr:alpha/beta fold hydrolase [Clostridia bacterium]
MTEEKFSCERDGMTIRGLVFSPEGENLPIAIISHGFMANYGTTKGYARWFAEHGCMSFCFDFNGGCAFGHSGKDRTKMTLYTEVEDLRAVLAYARGLKNTNPDDVTLMGCSQGGFVSAMLAAELKDEIRRLILFYPALCIPDDARAGRMMIMKFDPASIPDTLSFGPIKLGGDYARTVIDKHFEDMISPYEGPVLICWGTKDGIVAEKYMDGALAAYKNAVLYKIPGGRHGFSKKTDKAALGCLEEFIQKS